MSEKLQSKKGLRLLGYIWGYGAKERELPPLATLSEDLQGGRTSYHTLQQAQERLLLLKEHFL